MGLPEWDTRVDSRVLDWLRGLPSKECRQIVMKMLEMSRDPCPPDSGPLKGVEGGRRVDVGEYHLLYHVDPDARRVVFFVAGRRNDDEVYRELENLRRRIRDYMAQAAGARRP